MYAMLKKKFLVLNSYVGREKKIKVHELSIKKLEKTVNEA